MEEFLIIAIGIGILWSIFSLRGRVSRLEKILGADAVKLPSEGGQYASEALASQPLQKVNQRALNNELLAYIKRQIEQGVNKEQIKSALLSNGWQISDIDNVFNFISKGTVPSISGISPEINIEKGNFEKFIEWFKEDWILKLGAMLLILALGWFTRYAFLNNWIGPMGRIAIGITLGALFIILGYWRIRKYINQGGVFLALGSMTILLTIFAAREIYDFFTPESALFVMFLSVVFVALASVKYNSKALSLLSLILASIAPLLAKAPESDHIGLFAYLLIVTIGAIWIVFITGQRGLTLAALIIITFYSLPHILSTDLFPLVDNKKLLLFAYAFSALFFLTNTAGIIKMREKKIVADLITATGNGLFLLFWIMNVAQKEWQSLIISVWMIIFLVGAFALFKATGRKEPFYVYAGVSVAMLAAATAAELDGAALTIAYTIESGIVPLITYLVLHDIKTAKTMGLLFIGPVFLSFESIASSAWADTVVHKDFFVLFVLSITFFILGLFFLFGERGEDNTKEYSASFPFLVFGSIYAYILLWLSLHAGLENNNIAVTIALIIYTIIGIISYFYGLAKDSEGLKTYGTILIVLVVLRVVLIDAWDMVLVHRIITFLILGMLLIVTAFLRKKKHETLSG